MARRLMVSEKHGLNPSMHKQLCLYCLQDMGCNEILLYGKLPGDREAPMTTTTLSTDPCGQCAEFMRDGIICISIRDGEPQPQPDEIPNPYRTGGWCVIKEEAVACIFDPPLSTNIIKQRFMFIEDTAWDALGLPRGEAFDNRSK